MKNILIVLVLLLGCSKNETDNTEVFEVLVRYVGKEYTPAPQIILINRKPAKNYFPVSNYQIKKEALITIEKECQLKESEKIINKNAVVLIKINKDNKVKNYFFNQKNGIEILQEINKITTHHENGILYHNLSYLEIVAKNSKHPKL